MISRDFINSVKARRRVFGTPGLVLTDEIKEIEETINGNKKNSKPGEFYIPDKEIAGMLASKKKNRQCIQKFSEYLLTLLNKVDNDLWNNSFLFCNLFFDTDENKIVKFKKNENNINTHSSNFLNMDEIDNLMSETDTSDDLNDTIFDYDSPNIQKIDFCLQTKRETYLIVVRNIPTSPENPIFIIDNTCSNVNKELFELSKSICNFKTIDLIYNKTGYIILKNENWNEASSLVLHVKDLKNFLEEDYKNKKDNEIDFNNRIQLLSSMYECRYVKEETEFSKNIKKTLDDI